MKIRNDMADMDIHAKDRLREYRKTVRIFGIRKGVYLEFEYTVGFKELTIELVMPYAAFKEFCETNHVSKIDCDPDVEKEFMELAVGGLPKLFDHRNVDAGENVIQLGDYK